MVDGVLEVAQLLLFSSLHTGQEFKLCLVFLLRNVGWLWWNWGLVQSACIINYISILFKDRIKRDHLHPMDRVYTLKIVPIHHLRYLSPQLPPKHSQLRYFQQSVIVVYNNSIVLSQL